MVERCFRKARVVGSSPAPGSKIYILNMIGSRKNQIKGLLLSFVFILLSFLVIFLLLKFSIPLIVNLSSLVFSLRKDNQVEENSKIIPPPILFSSFEATNSALFVLKGKVFVDGKIIIFKNSEQIKEIAPTEEKYFSTDVSLNEGDNLFYAISETKENQNSQPSEPLLINLDTITPELEISSPLNETVFSGENQKNIIISGKTEKDAFVFVNDRKVIISKEGGFSASFTLQEGENKIIVSAFDPAGNKAETELTLFFNF